jgi:hypothetical protein
MDTANRTRKTRTGTWAEFIENLSPQERGQLKIALDAHANDWREGRRADKLGRVRGVNKKRARKKAA